MLCIARRRSESGWWPGERRQRGEVQCPGVAQPAIGRWRHALGLLLTTVNPKNLLLAIAAAGVIVDSGIRRAQQAGAYLAFSLLASMGVAIPLVVYLSMGQRAPSVLARFKSWMAKHSAKIMAVVLGLLGAVLLVQGVSGLLG